MCIKSIHSLTHLFNSGHGGGDWSLSQLSQGESHCVYTCFYFDIQQIHCCWQATHRDIFHIFAWTCTILSGYADINIHTAWKCMLYFLSGKYVNCQKSLRWLCFCRNGLCSPDKHVQVEADFIKTGTLHCEWYCNTKTLQYYRENPSHMRKNMDLLL